MNEETKKLIADEFNSLPFEIKEAISRMPWKKIIKEISSENNLSDEKAQALNIETAFVLFGLEPPEDFQANITREASLDDATAKNVSAAVSEKIFTPIENQIMMIRAMTPKVEKVVEQNKTQQAVEKSEPQAKTTELEIPPQMSLVPEGKVMDHLPPISPVQPKVQESTPPITQARPMQTAPIITGYDKNKDPYREPVE